MNRKAVPGNHAAFAPEAGIGPSPSAVELLDISEEEFKARFRHSPVKRTRWAGIRRNAAVALGNIGDPAGVPALVRALNSESALVRGHAAWALGRIGGIVAEGALRARQKLEEDEWVLEEIVLAVGGIAKP